MVLAITRDVSPRFNECEITHIDRTPIDVDVARAQHHEYVQALRQLGCDVLELPAEADLPDSVFVEDTAFILPKLAVITRPGADSRKPEIDSIVRVLAPRIKYVQLQAPATLDGGDVLVLGRDIYIGQSTRSNKAAVDQLNVLLGEYGYQVIGVQIHNVLHLKSAVTRVDDHTLLINPNWVDMQHFKEFAWIEVDLDEPFAANCLPVAGSIIFPTAFPKTAARLEAAGFRLVAVDISEMAKAEGAVTCCSLILANKTESDSG
jgi:dimethylargininase